NIMMNVLNDDPKALQVLQVPSKSSGNNTTGAHKYPFPSVDFASSHSRAFSFNLVDLSIGENLPSTAFCKAECMARYCLNLVLSWNVLFTPSMVIVWKIFFNDFVEYVFCAFELVFFSFFYPYYSKVRPFRGVPDFLDILCYDLFGFGVFLD
ncbi:hypothetical protein STEG23_011662, partial [Scotinomys teguina]